MLTNLISRAADEDRVLFNLMGRPAILAAAFLLTKLVRAIGAFDRQIGRRLN
jgi:hypothetical protein